MKNDYLKTVKRHLSDKTPDYQRSYLRKAIEVKGDAATTKQLVKMYKEI